MPNFSSDRNIWFEDLSCAKLKSDNFCPGVYSDEGKTLTAESAYSDWGYRHRDPLWMFWRKCEIKVIQILGCSIRIQFSNKTENTYDHSADIWRNNDVIVTALRCIDYSPFTRGLRDLCASLLRPKTGQVAVEGRREAERLPWSFKGGTRGVHTSPWTPWSPWSFEHVQNSRTKVAEEVGRSQVAQRRREEGTRIAAITEWMHIGRSLVTP